MKFHIYKAKDGWRWRLRARNGRIVADSGQAYSTPTACLNAAENMRWKMIVKMPTIVWEKNK